MEKVDAVGIELIGYDALQQKLYVKFRTNEKIYLYKDVEEDTYKTLMEQEHKTTFLNKEIKGAYHYEALSPESFIVKE